MLTKSVLGTYYLMRERDRERERERERERNQAWTDCQHVLVIQLVYSRASLETVVGTFMD